MFLFQHTCYAHPWPLQRFKDVELTNQPTIKLKMKWNCWSVQGFFYVDCDSSEMWLKKNSKAFSFRCCQKVAHSLTYPLPLFFFLSLPPTHPLSLSLTHTHSLPPCLSLSHTHTHTQAGMHNTPICVHVCAFAHTHTHTFYSTEFCFNEKLLYYSSKKRNK